MTTAMNARAYRHLNLGFTHFMGFSPPVDKRVPAVLVGLTIVGVCEAEVTRRGKQG
jgi:hypothetical protein